MWLNTTGGDLIEMDPATVAATSQQVVAQIVRGADAMGIHFNGLGTAAPSYCLCDPWDSSVPGLLDEVVALGDAVIGAFNEYAAATNELLGRARQLQADQAQVSAGPGLAAGGVDPSFGALLAQAIVNDSNNAAIGTWLGTRPSTSQVDILLAMQNQGGAGVGAGGLGFGGLGIGGTLAPITADANDHAAKVWLAPDGTSYAGKDDGGRDLYRDRQGDVGHINDIRRDTYDYNNNRDDRDYEVD